LKAKIALILFSYSEVPAYLKDPARKVHINPSKEREGGELKSYKTDSVIFYRIKV
jgi:hypothetical protein